MKEKGDTMSSRKRSAGAAFKAAQHHIIEAKKILKDLKDSKGFYRRDILVARLEKIQENIGCIRILIECAPKKKTKKNTKRRKNA
jgi:hypothetical protein